MNTVWVLVCDAGRARFFEVPEPNAPWILVSEALHEGGKESAHGSKDVEKVHFAHTLATTLDQAMRSKRFGHWVLVAPPHFVGVMKKDLTSELEKHLMTTIDKDFAHLPEKDLAERLHDAVQVPLDQLDAISHETVRHTH